MKKTIIIWIDKNNKQNKHRHQINELKKIEALYGATLEITNETVEVLPMKNNYILICSSEAYIKQKDLLRLKQYNLYGIIIYCQKVRDNLRYQLDEYVALVTNQFLKVGNKVVDLITESTFHFHTIEDKTENEKIQKIYEDQEDRLLVKSIGKQTKEFHNTEDYKSSKKKILEIFRLDFNVEKDFDLTKKTLINELKGFFKQKNILILQKEFQKIESAQSLTELVKVCIYLYSLQKVNIYQNLNLILKNIRLIKFQHEYSKLRLFSFLLLLNYFYFYSSTQYIQKVFRYTDYVPEQEEDSIITVCNYYSASKNQNLNTFKHKKSKIIIETFDHSRSCESLAFFNYLEVSKYSAFNKEQQVIFAPFTNFKVLKIVKEEPQNTIYLRELPVNLFLSNIYDLNLLQDNLNVTDKMQKQINYQLKYEKILNAKGFSETREMARIYSNFGAIYSHNNNFKWALSFYKKALDIYQKFKDEYQKSRVYNNLGLLNIKLGKNIEALDYFNKAEEIRITLQGQQSKNLIVILNNKASIYEQLNENMNALKLYDKALQICDVNYPKLHVNRAMLLNNIGFSQQSLKQYDSALKAYREALDIYSFVCGENSTNSAICYQNIAQVSSLMNKFQNAQQNYKKAIEVETQTKGEFSTNLIGLYNKLGSLYNKSIQYEKAKNCYQKALKVCIVQNGHTHRQTAVMYNNIGSLYESLGQHESALSYFEKAMSILSSIKNSKQTQIMQLVSENFNDLKQKLDEGLINK